MNGNRLDRIRTDFRAWIERPLGRSAPAARTRVLAQIAEEPGQVRFRPAAAVALVAAGLMVVVLLVVNRVPSGEPLNDQLNRGTVASTTAQASEDAGPLLIYELRSGTKLYLALAGHARTVAAESRDNQQGDES